MKALLFRKIVLDGVNYYQIFKEDDNFKLNPQIGSYSERLTKDYFYVEKDSDIKVPDESLFNIYCDEGNELKVVDSFELYDKVSKAFNNIYHYFNGERKSQVEVLNGVKKTILAQDICVKALISQLYTNQDVVSSNLPIDLKEKQKNNILFSGMAGSGKKSIVEALEREIDIPYADVYVKPDIKETIEDIIKQLIDRSKDDKEASHGVVFIRDNFNDLSQVMGQSFFNMMKFLTSQGPINFHGNVIDFRTVTFVILLDEYLYPDEEEIRNFQAVTNCICRIKTKPLSVKDKYFILSSVNGRLNQYEKFLNEHGKKLIIDDLSLIAIISKCEEIDPFMNAVNTVIDWIFRIGIAGGIDDIYIDAQMVNKIIPMIEGLSQESYEDTASDVEEFWFEKKIDEIVAKTKEYVLGQDENLRMLAHQYIENLRWANKDDVENPKDYIKNILIRGNTGTGKSFISRIMLPLLGVPYVIADATEYTEAGYIGKDVTDMLVDLYHAANDDLEKAERGVLAIDEVDKIAAKAGHGRDVNGQAVQEALYKIAEGTVVRINVGNRMNEIPVYFDTSRLTIVISGAFEGIENIRDERIGKRQAGFGCQDTTGKDTSITTEDYVSYGITAQFMRRVKNVIELNDISKEQLITIMKESKSSALKVTQDTARDEGIEIEYTDDFYEILAEKAMQMKQGVSGIEKVLIKVLKSINYYNIRASEVEKIVLNGEVINDPNKLIIVPRGKELVKKI